LNATELSPIAFPRYSRGTSSGTQLWRAGASNDCPVERVPATTKISHSARCPVLARIASVNAAITSAEFVTSSTRRRGKRSATTPASGESSSTGIADDAPRMPTSSAAIRAVPANFTTRYPSVVSCIHVPRLETMSPDHSSR
jgi:hypothetical protein